MGFDRGKMVARCAGYAAVLTMAGTVPVTVAAFAETTSAQMLQALMQEPAPAASAQTAPAEALPDAVPGDTNAAVVSDDHLAAAVPELDAELICMAKVVHHEAGSEPRAGQLAVAQLIVKRMKSGRFPASACGVANQRGQFFDIAGYHPSHADARWVSAVEVSQEAMAGTAEEVAPGAMFFRAAAGMPTSFFRSRERVATIGHQVFYR